MSLLTTESLSKSFGGLTAVDQLNMEIAEGEIVGLIGPNGSGKTTTFNLITGFYSADSGAIQFDNSDITGDSVFKRASAGIGRTFQTPKPFREMTVLENMLVANTPNLEKRQKNRRASEILDKIDLNDKSETQSKNLSGGQKKLLEIGRTLMLDPKLILLDEPAAGVNPALMDTILDHIRDINENGKTIMIIEHDMSVVSNICNRVVVMNNGKIISSGTFENVRNDQSVQNAYLGKHD